MKKKLALAAGLIAWAALIIVSMPAFAQVPDQTVVDSTTDADQSRVEQRRLTRQVELDELRAQRIAERCQAAQAKLSAHMQNAQAVLSQRKQAYTDTQEKLDSIIARLDVADAIDTSDLSIQASQLDAMVAEFLVHFETYLVALSDATEIDCVADPASFVAAIEEAREQLAELKLDSAEIRDYVASTISATISSIKAELSTEEEA